MENRFVTRFIAPALLGLSLALATHAPALAAQKGGPDREAIEQMLSRYFPGQKPDAIKETPLSGVYAVLFGTRIFYVSGDGRYLLDGTLYDLALGTDLSEPLATDARRELMKGLDEKEMIVFGPENPAWKVTVFTDIDCPYCRKLHNEMKEYNDLGIQVRYMLYPRTPPGSPSFLKAVSVWCADDRKAALTDAKNGKPVAPKQCDNPVGRSQELGRALGVNGTPTIFAEDGRKFGGYLPPKELLKRLEAGGG